MIFAGAEALVQDGTVTIFAISFLAMEALALVLLVGRRQILPILANGLAGLFLILALHAALTGGTITAVSTWLGLGGLAHIADLVLRLRRRG